MFVPMHNLTRTRASGGLLMQPMDMINLLQTISLNPRIVRAESGSIATIYWGAACVFDLLYTPWQPPGFFRPVARSFWLLSPVDQLCVSAAGLLLETGSKQVPWGKMKRTLKKRVKRAWICWVESKQKSYRLARLLASRLKLAASR